MHDFEGGIPPAESFLWDRELVVRASPQRQAMLWCIGCCVLTKQEAGAEPVVHPTEIQKCTDIPSGVVAPGMRRLEAVGVLVSEMEQVNAAVIGRPRRRLYSTAPTPLGQAFHATLKRPSDCPAREQQAANDNTAQEENIIGTAVSTRQEKMSAAEMARLLGISIEQLLEIEQTGRFRIGLFVKYVKFLGIKISLEFPDGDSVDIGEHLDG